MMDAVQIFNEELQSLVDLKPPVSKVKMGQITKAAMRGIKFYKHIVKGVEKFIVRCEPEYKVPGLYVIDSIVRQSRHQFGAERDVYAARFANNLDGTFQTLFSSCMADDRPKIVRVLNLWQKNGVFESHVIQPLLDMASPSATLAMDPKSPSSGDNSSLKQDHVAPKYSAYNSTSSLNNNNNNNNNNSGSNNNNNNNSSSSSNINNNNNHSSSSGAGRHERSSEGGLKFTKNMLDFDYDEDDDDAADETPTEAEPPLSSTLSKIEMEQRAGCKRGANKSNDHNISSYQSSSQKNLDSEKFHSTQQQQQRANQDPVLERWNRLLRQQSGELTPGDQEPPINQSRQQRSRSRSPPNAHQTSASRVALYTSSREAAAAATGGSTQASATTAAAATRLQSNSNKNSTTGSSASTRDAERSAERERKCLPRIRDKHLTVCSSTLWLGHVPKLVSEADISDAFGEFGTINSIDLIPPRGCAYVCMDRRQDAKRALSESKHLKLNGGHIKMAWAPGKGFKEYKKLKDFWEADIGASFIPYSKVDDSIDFETLEEGGVIDEDSMSLEMRERREKRAAAAVASEPTMLGGGGGGGSIGGGSQEFQQQQQQQPAPGLSLPLPVLPMLNQPPPLSQAASLPPFSIPPSIMSIPPPPSVLGQGLIPFPPPGVMGAGPIASTAPSGGHMLLQPQHSTTSIAKMAENNLNSEQRANNGNDNGSPNNIDQQLSMTERQISMVEQQLSMIQAQGMGHQLAPLVQPMQPMQAMQPMQQQQQQAMFFPHNQPNPMMFDMQPPPNHMLHSGGGGQLMLDPQQMAMFMNPLHMLGQPPMMNPMGMMNPSEMESMSQNPRDF